MTSIRNHHEAESLQVEFRFYRKDATQAWLVGDFTRWQKGRLVMDRQEDGWWTLNVPLAPGDYRFRYVVDAAGAEAWFTDFAAHGVEFADGQWNSVVAVPERNSPIHPTANTPERAAIAA